MSKKGASLAGGEEIVDMVNRGLIPFDKCLATSDMMGDHEMR